LLTLGAGILLGFVALRVASWAEVRARTTTALMIGAALLCTGYGILGALSARERSPIDLVFYADRGEEVRTHEDRIVVGRAGERGLFAFSLLLAGCSRLIRSPPTKRRRRRLSRFAWIGLIAGAPYLLTFVGALINPPRGYDALWYHLPLAVSFSRAHHLEPPGRDLTFYFPGNVELLARSLLDIFGVRALCLVQWPFALGAAAAAHALACAIGFRRSAWFAAALVLCTPMVLYQSALAYTDVVALFAVTVAASLFSVAVRTHLLRRSASHAALGGLSLGLLLGAKYAALPLVACALLVLFLFSLGRDGHLRWRHLPHALALVAVAGLAMIPPSLFWYWRNLRLTGNPLFPIAVPSLGLPGLFVSTAFNRQKELEFVSSRTAWWIYPFIEKTSHESGFGAGFACVVPLGVILIGAVLVHRLLRGRAPVYGLPLMWGCAYLVLWWVETPHEVRHLLPLITLFGTPALGLFESRRARSSLVFVLTAGLFFSTLTSIRVLLFSPVAELSIRPRSYAALYDLPPALTEQLPNNAKIANFAGRPYNFPLLGPNLSRRVHEFSPNATTDHDLTFHQVGYIFYRGPEASAPQRPSFRLMYQEMAKNHAWWITESYSQTLGTVPGSPEIVSLYSFQ
jgi:hypothetical protein